MIEYGVVNRYVDVTNIAKKLYLRGNQLIIPSGPKDFNKYYGDPCPHTNG